MGVYSQPHGQFPMIQELWNELPEPIRDLQSRIDAALAVRGGIDPRGGTYGAVGDGVTDDHDALQACIDANPTGTILLAADFICDGELVLTDLVATGRNFQGQIIIQGDLTFTNDGDPTDSDVDMQRGFVSYPKVNGAGGDSSGLGDRFVIDLSGGGRVFGPANGASFYAANSSGITFKGGLYSTNRYGIVLECSIGPTFEHVQCDDSVNAGIAFLFLNDTARVYYASGTPEASYWNDSPTISKTCKFTSGTGRSKMAAILDHGSNSQSIRNIGDCEMLGTPYGYLARKANPRFVHNWTEDVVRPFRILTTNASLGAEVNIAGITDAQPSGTYSRANFPDGYSFAATVTGNMFTRALVNINLQGVSAGTSIIGQNKSSGLDPAGFHLVTTESGGLVIDLGDTDVGGAPLPMSIGFPATYLKVANLASEDSPTFTTGITVQGFVNIEGASGALTVKPRDGSGTEFTIYNPTGDDLKLNSSGVGDVLSITPDGHIGIGEVPSTAQFLAATGNAATVLNARLANSNAGGRAAFRVSNDLATAPEFGVRGSTTAAAGAFAPDEGYMYSPKALTLMAETGVMKFAAGSSAEVMRLTSTGLLLSLSTATLFLKDTSTGFQSASSTVLTPLTDNVIRSTSYTSGLEGWNISAAGNAEFNNVDVRGAIHASIFTYNAINVTAGTQLVTPSGAKLKSNVIVTAAPTYGTTTFTIDVVDQEGLSHAASQLFAVNDILRLKDGLIGDTWFKVTAVSDQTTFWRYTASIQAGTANVTYRAGMGVPDYGVSGKGGIMLTADQTNAPYLQMFTHAGTFSSADASGSLILTPLLRLGNLNGSYGYASDIYGLGTGQHGAASKTWLTVDQTNGIRIGNNVTQLAQWDVSGNILIGEVAGSKANTFISAGAFAIRLNTTNLFSVDTSGNVAFGTVAADQGNAFWNNSNKRLEFRGSTAGTVVQAYIDTTGAFVSAGGNVALNATGLQVVGHDDAAFSGQHAVSNVASINGAVWSAFYDYNDPIETGHQTIIRSNAIASRDTILAITSDAPTGKSSTVDISALVNSVGVSGVNISETGLRFFAGGFSAERLTINTSGQSLFALSSTSIVPLQIKNTHASGFSGIEYLDNSGAVKMFSGVGNASPHFRFNAVGVPLLFMYSATTRIEINSTGIGVLGATPVARQTVTGSRGGNAALASLLTGLANIGWITDSSTA